MTTLYANPYDTTCTGFYFDSIEQFNQKLSQANYEEVEIEYIDGDNPRLFQAADIHQRDIDLWFDELDKYPDNGQEALSIGYLLDIMHLDEAIKRRDDVILHRGSLADYAFELVSDLYPLDELPDIIKYHIDYDSIARDLELNSEVTELSRNIWVVNCHEF
ncbi:MAG: hypothetical protein ACI845_003605 [Gammaproteobacteria bacterium]|jgi:hypothetical protein